MAVKSLKIHRLKVPVRSIFVQMSQSSALGMLGKLFSDDKVDATLNVGCRDRASLADRRKSRSFAGKTLEHVHHEAVHT